MSDLSEPDAYRRTSTYEPQGGGGGCGAPWFWIIMFIISLLVITALIVALVYAYRRVTKGQDLLFKGAIVKVGKDNSTLTASWPDTSKKSDKVTLYATLNPPQFDTDGKVLNAKITPVVAASGQNSVTLNGLSPGLKYYATVTVVNSDTYNYQVYTQIVYMEGITPVTKVPGETGNVNNTFAIEDIIQLGRIQLDETGEKVTFNQRPSQTGSLWYVDTGSVIKNKDNDTKCLYNNNGVLGINDCPVSSSGAVDVNNQWTYGGGKLSNQWCLTSTIDDDKPKCMVLGGISNGSATITVTDNVDAGDSWANAFEIYK